MQFMILKIQQDCAKYLKILHRICDILMDCHIDSQRSALPTLSIWFSGLYCH